MTDREIKEKISRIFWLWMLLTIFTIVSLAYQKTRTDKLEQQVQQLTYQCLAMKVKENQQ